MTDGHRNLRQLIHELRIFATYGMYASIQKSLSITLSWKYSVKTDFSVTSEILKQIVIL